MADQVFCDRGAGEEDLHSLVVWWQHLLMPLVEAQSVWYTSSSVFHEEFESTFWWPWFELGLCDIHLPKWFMKNSPDPVNLEIKSFNATPSDALPWSLVCISWGVHQAWLFFYCTGRAWNSVYLGNRVASQKKVWEPKTQEEGKRRRKGVRKREGRSSKRGVKMEETKKV